MTTTYLLVPVPENISAAFIALVDLRSPLSDTEIATDEPTSHSREKTVPKEWTVNLLGEKYLAEAKRDALVWGYQQLHDLDVSFLPKLSKKVLRTRRLVARSPEGLYIESPHLAYEAREICPGWYADTNLDKGAILKRLQIACEVAGLKFGTDLIVNLDVLENKALSDDEL
jgi:hypothetical protein